MTQHGMAVWPGLLDQWLLARSELGMSGPTLLPASELDPHYFYESSARTRPYGGFYELFHGICSGRWNGLHLVYVRVYKSGNDAICRQLRRPEFSTNSDAPGRPLIFSFVREPLSHFESGYSEIAARAAAAAGYRNNSDRYSFLRSGDAAERARAFVRDLLAGALRRATVAGVDEAAAYGFDQHAFPQVAFLSRALPETRSDNISAYKRLHPHVMSIGKAPMPYDRLHALGTVDSASPTEMSTQWAAIGQLASRWLQQQAAGSSSPTMGDAARWPAWVDEGASHPTTSIASLREGTNRDREAMHALLAASSDASTSPLDRAFAVAICRVLLPDFVCFGFQLPLWCAQAIGATHNVSCEPLGVALPRRRCAAREGARCRAGQVA